MSCAGLHRAVTALSVHVSFVLVSTAAHGQAPELPRALVDTQPVPATGITIAVPAGGDLQGALDAALPGDVITLHAGATYVGPYTLREKAGASWIVVRTSAPDSALPAPGMRIGPSYAAVLPKIVTPGSGPALQTAPGAHHFRLVGVEVGLAPGVTRAYDLVRLGEGSGAQGDLSRVPHHLILDRVYIHGTPNADVRRGVAMNSASTAVIDSHISDVHEVGADSQAICGWNGPGPFKIANNRLEGAGENVLFGGADPAIAGLVPSDIEVRGNHFWKPLSWRIEDPSYAGRAWTVKNIFELKNAQRVLVEGNVFENNWRHAQNGFAILFTVRNQDGGAPWSVVQDVVFRRNVVRHVASAVNILGTDDLQPSQRTKRILIQDNLLDDVDGPKFGGGGRLFQVLSGPQGVVIDHNTGRQTGDPVAAAGSASDGFVYRNNLTANGPYGVGGDGTFGNPLLTLAQYFPGAIFSKNVLVGGNVLAYPLGNFFPISWSQVFFVDLAAGDYRLADTSPYKNAGTDGKDVGADIQALLVTPTPTPTSAPRPTPTPTAAPTAAPTATPTATRTPTPTSAPRLTPTPSVTATAMPTATPRPTPTRTPTPSAPTPTPLPAASVTWTQMVNVSPSGGGLMKSAGCDGCQDAGAVSVQTIASGNGHLEVVAAETDTDRVVGLSLGNADTTWADIDFSLGFRPGGYVEVRENGAYRADTTYAPGNVFRIAVLSGVVKYYKGGALLYTSSAAPRYPLLVDTTFFTRGATLGAVTLSGSNVSASAEVTWTSLVRVSASGGVLTKTAGCDGCQDAGAVSTQTIVSGDGSLEVTASEPTTHRVIGLGVGNSGTTAADVDFGLSFLPGGLVEVREKGAYRGDTAYVAGDVFRVAVESGRVSYYRNGVRFYTSATVPAYPLLADTCFLTRGATVSRVVLRRGP